MQKSWKILGYYKENVLLRTATMNTFVRGSWYSAHMTQKSQLHYYHPLLPSTEILYLTGNWKEMWLLRVAKNDKIRNILGNHKSEVFVVQSTSPHTIQNQRAWFEVWDELQVWFFPLFSINDGLGNGFPGIPRVTADVLPRDWVSSLSALFEMCSGINKHYTEVFFLSFRNIVGK